MKNKPQQNSSHQDFDIHSQIEGYIENFMQSEERLCYEAKLEGWLGEPWRKGQNGLLGYMRTSFGLQLKILNKLSDALTIYPKHHEIVEFFRSDWFADSVMRNGGVMNFYKKEHFEILKAGAVKRTGVFDLETFLSELGRAKKTNKKTPFLITN